MSDEATHRLPMTDETMNRLQPTRTNRMMMNRPLALGALLLAILFTTTDAAAQPAYEANRKLPAIPLVEGEPQLRVIYPESAMTRPNVKRNFIFGSTGNGRMTLTINGTSVRVAPNGAYLAFLRVPRDREYDLVGVLDGDTSRMTYRFAPDDEPTSSPTVRNVHPTPITGEVTGGVDTLASGSGIAYGAPTKWANREWFFPIGTRFPVLERNGDHFRIDLDGITAWVEAEYVTTRTDRPRSSEIGVDIGVRPEIPWTDLVIPVDGAPFRVEATRKKITLTFYNAYSRRLETEMTGGKKGRYTVANLPDDLVDAYSWRTEGKGARVRLDIDLRRSLWGFKTFYDDAGSLVLRIRRPNTIDAEDPLRGLTIMVDAGHPPRGATGPTGLTEADANLAISLVMEKKLKQRGAHVVMTRRDRGPLLTLDDVSAELTARVDHAVAQNADILISVHNNGFSDGIDPWKRNGTETYYYHTFASGLAKTVQKEIVGVTGVPSLGHKQRSLALIRPTWMPAILTESLYMMHPQQEQALRDSAFLDRLAEAHIRGVENWVRGQ